MVRLEIVKNDIPNTRLAVVQCPAILSRLIRLPRINGQHEYVFLGQLIGHFLPDLFPGTKILGYWPFRLTRNSELYVDEEDTPNLLQAVEDELHNRRRGDAVRLEIAHDCPAQIWETLLKTLRLTEDDLYLIDGPLNPTRLMLLCQGDHSPELRDPPFLAPIAVGPRQHIGMTLIRTSNNNFCDSLIPFFTKAPSNYEWNVKRGECKRCKMREITNHANQLDLPESRGCEAGARPIHLNESPPGQVWIPCGYKLATNADARFSTGVFLNLGNNQSRDEQT